MIVSKKLFLGCVIISVVLLHNLGNALDASQFIGLGYNLLLGNPDGGDLHLVGVDPGIKTTRHILQFSDDTKKSLIVTDGKSNCDPHNTTSIFYGPKSYQDYLLGDIVTFGPGDSGVLPFAFSKSTSFQDIEHRTTANHDVFRDIITVCNSGRTRYVMPPMYPNLHHVSDEFTSEVCHLPTEYDKDAYKLFLDTWGTHVIIGVDIGTKSVTRYEQSIAQLAEVLLTYDIGVGSVKLESYMGYGSVVHLNVSNLHHDDYFRIQGGQVDASYNIGTGSSQQPVAYKMATIANFMDEIFWSNTSQQNCGEGVSYYLPHWRNNTIKALMEYPALNGRTLPPVDPDIKIPVTWPHGTYGLCKPRVGCPTSPLGWAEGWNRQDAEDTSNDNYWTPDIHLAGSMEHNKPVFYYCMKTTDENSEYERNWPIGNYCIFKRGNCPTGFTSGSIFWDDEDTSTDNGHGGTLPDGAFNSNTRIDYCCRSDGFSRKPILLPVDHQFYLFRYTSTCQEVFGMTVKEEIFTMDTEDLANKDYCSGAHPYNPHCDKNHEIHYCYYEKQAAQSFPSVIFG